MKPLKFYGLRQCSTCRQAVKWLVDNGVAFQELAIRETPPDPAELRTMLKAQQGGIRRLFNTSGLEYRALGLARQLPGLTTDEALELLAGNGSLVKRPFLMGPGVALVGFDPAEWTRSLGRVK